MFVLVTKFFIFSPTFFLQTRHKTVYL